MAEFNQSATAVERARVYLADVRAGHVSFADEGAPFLTLTGYLGAVLDVIDGTGSTRAVRVAARAVLAELPDAGQLRCDGEADQSPSFWIARLAAALRQLLGSTAARLAALEEAERDALRQALTDAVGVRAAAAAQPCPDCVVHPALLCPRHAGELDWVSSYRMLAEDLGLELAPVLSLRMTIARGRVRGGRTRRCVPRRGSTPTRGACSSAWGRRGSSSHGRRSRRRGARLRRSPMLRCSRWP